MNGAVGYVYDPVGNRQQKTSTLPGYPGGTSSYNANDQLTTDTYDANGNTTQSVGLGYIYDFENHVVQAGSSVVIVYDGDGNRVSKTTANGTTQYLVDDVNPTRYAQVVDELQSGAVSKTYTWGLELIAQTQPQPSPGAAIANYYVFDGHGSVRALTNAAGAVTDTYDYDAFGNLIHSTGSTPNNYLFAGEQFDPDLGMYFLRARYLNPGTGRFWTMDSYEGDPQSPVTLHKFSYAGAEPVNRLDPSGNDDIAEVSEAEAIGEDLDAEASEEELERPKPTRPWTLFDVTCVPGTVFFSHEFIWAKNNQTQSGWGYHVIALNPRDMVASRNLGISIPGAFLVVPQPDVTEAPLFGSLPIESQIPITVMTDGQFGLWNAAAVTLGGICDLQSFGGGWNGNFPYQMPTNTCKTWTTEAATLAITISLLPF